MRVRKQLCLTGPQAKFLALYPAVPSSELGRFRGCRPRSYGMATSMSPAYCTNCRILPILNQHQLRVRVTLPHYIDALRSPFQTARFPSTFSQALRQQCVRRRRILATAAVRDAGSGDEGDPDLQDNLVSMLRLQIGKKHVDAFVDAEEEKLKQSVEEVIRSTVATDGLCAAAPVVLCAPIPPVDWVASCFF